MPNKVTSSNDILVLKIDPGRPSVHMPDFSTACSAFAEQALDLTDLAGQVGGTGIATIQVLAPDAYGNDPLGAVLLDGLEQGCLLGFVVGIVRCPDADE